MTLRRPCRPLPPNDPPDIRTAGSQHEQRAHQELHRDRSIGRFHLCDSRLTRPQLFGQIMLRQVLRHAAAFEIVRQGKFHFHQRRFIFGQAKQLRRSANLPARPLQAFYFCFFHFCTSIDFIVGFYSGLTVVDNFLRRSGRLLREDFKNDNCIGINIGTRCANSGPRLVRVTRGTAFLSMASVLSAASPYFRLAAICAAASPFRFAPRRKMAAS